MALDDYAPTTSMPVARSSGPSAPEDEDLFDFPRIEMVLEAERTTPETSRSPLESNSMRPKIETSAPPVEVMPKARVEPTRKRSQPAAETLAPQRSLGAEIAPAAMLIDDLENVFEDDLGASLTGLGDAAQRNRAARKRRRSAWTSPSTLLLGGLALLNLAAFVFFWQTSRSFRASLEGLRNDMTVTAHDLVVGASERESTPRTSKPSTQPASHTTASTPSIPLDSHERTTLTLASQEIEAGKFTDARKRLQRLVAVADDIDPDLRADVEARASYAIADSYRAQAKACAEAAR